MFSSKLKFKLVNGVLLVDLIKQFSDIIDNSVPNEI